MAYLALYRKWRPTTFDEVVGQKHISIPLLRALKQNRLAHAYLFSGPRGTGKTSMARIMAKAVNCLQSADGNPCNDCANCREINQGSSMDVYEIDGASARGVDEILRIRKSIPTLPVACKKKIYIIDEVHMLTREAFNALLKTLEEPPSHVLFILATTEPEKMPLTILSRCQRYEFHRISVSSMKDHLLSVASKSDISITPEAADLIAVRAEGGLRDALSLLDQCSALASGEELTVEMVYTLLGLTGKDQIISLSQFILDNKKSDMLQLFYDILQSGKEPIGILRDLSDHFRSLMIYKVNPNAPELSAYGKNITTLRKQTETLSEPYLDALFSSLHDTLFDVKKSASPRMSAEMGLLRLCRIKGSKALDSLVERIEALEKEIRNLSSRKSSPSSIPSPAPTATPPSAIPFTPPSAPNISAGIVPPPTPKTPSKKKAPSRPKKEEASPTAAPISSTGSSQAPTEERVLNPEKYENLWKEVLAYVQKIHRLDVWTCIQKSHLLLLSNTRAVAVAPQRFMTLGLSNENYQSVLSDAFQELIGIPLMVRAVLKGSPEEADIQSYLKSCSFRDNLSSDSTSDGYTMIDRDNISSAVQGNKILEEALKILPDCDIYQKE